MIETQQALDSKAMGVFTDLLSNKSKSIKAKAARDIFDLRFYNQITKICFNEIF